eukprot:NODE_368_length_10016_cov_0.215791.p7 type:complete len:141 gc:universal NODE_368_length_10016_cov_0.215791:5813-5391(-)
MENLLSPQYASNPFKKQVFRPKHSANKDLLVFEQRILMNRKSLYKLAFRNVAIIILLCSITLLLSIYFLIPAVAYTFKCYWQLHQAYYYTYTVNKSLRPFAVQFMKIGSSYEMVFDDCVPKHFRSDYEDYRKIWRSRKVQ